MRKLLAMVSGVSLVGLPLASTGSTCDSAGGRLLGQEAGAQGVGIVDLPAGVGLRADGGGGAAGLLGDAGEEQVAERIGGEIHRAVPDIGRDLEIERADMLLQRQNAEFGAFALVLVQCGAVEIRHAVDRKAQRGLAGIVRNLEIAIETAEQQAQPCLRVEHDGNMRQTVELIGGVVQRIEAGGGVLDAAIVVQVVAGEEPVDRAAMAAILDARLRPVPTSAGHPNRDARVGDPGFCLDIHHTGGLEAILRRQRAGVEGQLVGETGGNRLAEHRQTLGQFHPIEAILHIGVFAAQMDLTETVQRHAGGMHQHVRQRRIRPLRQGVERLRAEMIGTRPQAGLDLLALCIKAT